MRRRLERLNRDRGLLPQLLDDVRKSLGCRNSSERGLRSAAECLSHRYRAAPTFFLSEREGSVDYLSYEWRSLREDAEEGWRCRGRRANHDLLRVVGVVHQFP
jgi:hypothetical protein